MLEHNKERIGISGFEESHRPPEFLDTFSIYLLPKTPIPCDILCPMFIFFRDRNDRCIVFGGAPEALRHLEVCWLLCQPASPPHHPTKTARGYLKAQALGLGGTL